MKIKRTLEKITNWIPLVGDIQDLLLIKKTRSNSYAHNSQLWEWHYYPGDCYSGRLMKRLAVVAVCSSLLFGYELNRETQKKPKMQDNTGSYNYESATNSGLKLGLEEK